MSDQWSDRWPRVDQLDRRLTSWMHRYGHDLDRWAIGGVFVWFGLLKVFGFKSATSVIADTVYVGDPEITVRFLGLWEAAIGVALIFHALNRVAIALLIVRLPGTLLALVLSADVSWTDTFPVPTIQGQYLIKDAILFSAAMAIGGGVRHRKAEPAEH